MGSLEQDGFTQMSTFFCAGCLLAVIQLVCAQEDLLALYGAPGGESTDPAILALSEAIPGTPGEDYPIYSTPPETSFTCDDGKIEGYYGDPEAECQQFHICANDGNGGLIKYSFLCPNGTVFNQAYFICDWWFNFDCSTTEDLYYINEEVAAAAAAATAASAGGESGGLDLSINARNGRGGRQEPGFSSNTIDAPGIQQVSNRKEQIEKLPLVLNDQPRGSGGSGNGFGTSSPQTTSANNFPSSKIPVKVLGGKRGLRVPGQRRRGLRKFRLGN